MKKLYTNVKIPATSKLTIARADDVFSYIDSDFENYGTDKKSPNTNAVDVAVLGIDKNGTFVDIFGSISKDTNSMVMTQAQIIEFLKKHEDKLCKEWYTFFLFKVDKEFFVAYVDFDDVGQLLVRVDRFSFGSVWDAELLHRFVVPQLALGNLKSDPLSETLNEIYSGPLTLSPSDTLESACAHSGLKHTERLIDRKDTSVHVIVTWCAECGLELNQVPIR